MKNIFGLLLLLLGCSGKSFGQDIIRLKNPSFEDMAKCCEAPRGWDNLGQSVESPPDVQPGSFGCRLRPQDGKTYVGLVVRDNKTWESIGQDLDVALQQDTAYSFSLYLAQSPQYISLSRRTGREVNYDTPAVLRIWGYNRATKKEEMLAESPAIAHRDWVRYDFVLKPTTTDCDALDLEAYFTDDGKLGVYNGNLLIDYCSAIVQLK